MSRAVRPLGVFLVVLAGLLLPLPISGRVGKYALDFAHVFVGAAFAGVTLVLLRPRVTWPLWQVCGVAWVVATLAGAAMEKVQGLVGREASLVDAVTNALGAAAFLLVVLARRRPAGLRGALQLLALVALLAGAAVPARHLFDAWRQARAMPQLASFEDDLELTRWRFLESTGRRVHRHVTDGDGALRVRLHAAAYPGVTLAWAPADWSPYKALVFDLHLDEGPALPLTVKVEDAETDGSYGDRFHAELQLEPGPNTFRIPLAEVQQGAAAREIDLTAIRLIQWFFDGLEAPRVMHLDHVRLEGTRGD